MRRRVELPKFVTGPWNLADLGKTVGIPKHGLKVFSCFHCCGGSTMGYKLAGFDVVGGVEIDPRMMEIYRKNHHPRHSYLMGVQEFKGISNKTLPDELFHLDILDGSPPCSSFSMSGAREDGWQEKKKFREGQADQVLDNLFFDFIEIADKLRPKFVIAENVKGLVMGQARGYVKEIFQGFNDAGYETQLFLLNASRMGVPQGRERTFFVARRKDLVLPEMKIDFYEDPIGIAKACEGATTDGKPLTKMALELWKRTLPGQGMNTAHPRKSWFAHRRPHPFQPIPTVIAGTPSYHWAEPRYLSRGELLRAQTFPDDFDLDGHEAQYVCGMSVPPLMMQRVATQVGKSLMSRIGS